jgi:hypothetical protein
MAWLTKLLLDTEPDVQRRLARLSVGPAPRPPPAFWRPSCSVLLVCAAAMAAPWLFHGIDTGVALGSGIVLGVLAHLLAVPPGGRGRRAGQPGRHRSVRLGLTVLVVAAVLVVVLGLSGSFAPGWSRR